MRERDKATSENMFHVYFKSLNLNQITKYFDLHFHTLYMHVYLQIYRFNSFRANGDIEVFTNNTYLSESTSNQLSHPKSALFAF